MRTGSLVVISVVAVDTISLCVVAAMNDSSVVGALEKNGGLWCSPIANTSRPTSSVFCAILTSPSIRSASLGVWSVTGPRVMSLTEKIPNCMFDASLAAAVAVPASFSYMRLHVSSTQAVVRYSRGARRSYRTVPCQGSRGTEPFLGQGSPGTDPYWARVPLARLYWSKVPMARYRSALGERRKAVAAGPLVGFLAE